MATRAIAEQLKARLIDPTAKIALSAALAVSGQQIGGVPRRLNSGRCGDVCSRGRDTTGHAITSLSSSGLFGATRSSLCSLVVGVEPQKTHERIVGLLITRLRPMPSRHPCCQQTMSPTSQQLTYPHHPVCRRPASWGAGRRWGRHVERTLTARTTAGGPGGGLLGLPWTAAGGMAEPSHHRGRQRSRRSCGHPGPGGPAGGAVTAAAPRPNPRRRTARGGSAERSSPYPQASAVGRHRPWSQRLRASRRACGVTAVQRQRSGGQAPRRRRERPVSGRLEDVQKVLPDLDLDPGLDPAAGRLRFSGPATSVARPWVTVALNSAWPEAVSAVARSLRRALTAEGRS
jgi:hypothetical protein